MRELTPHIVNPANDKIQIKVIDEPGAGGANHVYEVVIGEKSIKIEFQNGPINEAGVNGITQEVLLAIIRDRLESFQKGPFACKENGRALASILDAIHWLEFRTLKRMARNVEGTNKA